MYLLISDEASVLRIFEKTRLAFKDSQISQNSFVRHDFQNIYIYICTPNFQLWPILSTSSVLHFVTFIKFSSRLIKGNKRFTGYPEPIPIYINSHWITFKKLNIASRSTFRTFHTGWINLHEKQRGKTRCSLLAEQCQHAANVNNV